MASPLSLLRPLFAALLACAGGSALAAPGCRLLDTVGGQLGSVTGSGRAPLLRATAPDGSDCPAVGGCGAGGYLLPGDPLVLGATSGGLTCVTFVSVAGRQTSAWLDRRRLRVMAAPPAASPKAWVGLWRLGPEEIAVRRNGDSLSLRGYAQWPWAPAPGQRREDFTPNTGSLQQTGTPHGGTLAAQGACSVSLRLLGPYLLVRDDTAERCWGANVSFTGVYRRASASVSEPEWRRLASP